MASIALAIGLGVAGAAVAGGGAMMASKNKASAPDPRNPNAELGSVDWNQWLSTQKDLAGYQVNQLYPQMVKQEIKGTNKTRSANLKDLGQFGLGYQHQLDQLNPHWQQALSLMGNAATTAGSRDDLSAMLNQHAMQGSPIADELQSQALAGLHLGTQLSPEQIRESQQATRSAFSDRGLSMSNPAMFAEALNRDQFGQARYQQRLANAGSAFQIGQAQDQFGLGVENQNQTNQVNAQNFLATNAQVQQNGIAPVLGFFGQRTAVPVTAPASIMNASTSSMSPVLGYYQDANDTNYNADAAARIANFNGKAAMAGGLMKMGGSMMSAGVGAYGS